MGLPVSVLVRGDDADGPAAGQAVSALYAELRVADATFSTYREDSELSRWARGEVARPSADLQEVRGLCELAAAQTAGAFDACRPDGSWDPSGLVKGWAVERAARPVAALDGLDWCVNAGGDVLLQCFPGASFRIGIQDPRDAARVAVVVERSEGAVATSGTAARGRHLYDPRTGEFTEALGSVTVVGPSLHVADVLATAAYVDGGLALVEQAYGYEGLVITRDGTLQWTPGWRAAGTRTD